MDVLIYGYYSKLLEVHFILCPFIRIIVVGSSVGPMTYLAMSSWSSNGVEQDLNPIKK